MPRHGQDAWLQRIVVNVVLSAVAEQTPALCFEAADDLGSIRFEASSVRRSIAPNIGAFIGHCNDVWQMASDLAAFRARLALTMRYFRRGVLLCDAGRRSEP